MKKFLLGLVVFLCIAFGATELILPAVASRAVRSQLQAVLQTDEVTADVSSFPAVRMFGGHFGHFELEAENALLGDLRVARMTLIGDKVDIPPKVLMGKARGDTDKGKFYIDGAERLELRGIVTEESLADLINRKVEHVSDVSVKLTPKKAIVDGKVKLFGNEVNVNVECRLYGEKNAIMLQMTRIDLKHSFFGKGGIAGDLLGDIELVDFNRMKLPVELDEIEQQDGQAVLTASHHHKK